MPVRKRVVAVLPLTLLLLGAAKAPPPAHEVVRIWPGPAAGTTDAKSAEEEADVTLPVIGKVHIVTNVTVPTLTIFRPAAGKANGTAMIVMPGGSFRALAWDIDGIESSRWLAAHGITAFLLKYRVRPLGDGESFGDTLDDFARATVSRRAAAVADAGQAVRFVRSHAAQYGIRPDRVGLIGFSAGGMATEEAAIAKEADARPDFAVVMYGAALSSALPGADAPPVFIAAAQDDDGLPATNSAEIFQRWTKVNRPAELHIYERGGHGFGFRHHNSTSDGFPADLERWLASRGYLAKRR